MARSTRFGWKWERGEIWFAAQEYPVVPVGKPWEGCWHDDYATMRGVFAVLNMEVAPEVEVVPVEPSFAELTLRGRLTIALMPMMRARKMRLSTTLECGILRLGWLINTGGSDGCL